MNTHRIYDIFNRRVISKHRSLRTAVLALAKFNRSITRHNGSNSYIPTIIEFTKGPSDWGSASEWIKVPIEDIHDAQDAAGIR